MGLLEGDRKSALSLPTRSSKRRRPKRDFHKMASLNTCANVFSMCKEPAKLRFGCPAPLPERQMLGTMRKQAKNLIEVTVHALSLAHCSKAP